MDHERRIRNDFRNRSTGSYFGIEAVGKFAQWLSRRRQAELAQRTFALPRGPYTNCRGGVDHQNGSGGSFEARARWLAVDSPIIPPPRMTVGPWPSFGWRPAAGSS